MMTPAPHPVTHYNRPGKGVHFFNGIVAWLADRGITLAGARTLEVRGRKSGNLQRIPVNPLRIDGRTYLIGARGDTQWSRNVRAAGSCTLRGGRKAVTYRVVEVATVDKPTVLRPYLKRWGWEVGALMPVKITATSTDAELLSAGAAIPVFELIVQPHT
jgi:deazaflavin-dependent oxidoreductase (nitroreductase family)